MEVDLSNKLQIMYVMPFHFIYLFILEIIYLYFNIFQKEKRVS